jgi:hypothetical protein
MLPNYYHYYRYPQYIWAREICKILKSGIIEDIKDRNIIDAPCGDGIISFWVKKSVRNDFYLYDIEKSRIQIASDRICNVHIFEEDIFHLKINSENNIWFFINSLYCLPDKDKLLENMKYQTEYIIGVFPHTDHENYRAFLNQNPGFVNASEMNREQTISFFKEFHFDLLQSKDVTFISYYKKRKIIFHSINDILYNLFDGLYKKKKGAYWIGVFKKNNSLLG